MSGAVAIAIYGYGTIGGSNEWLGTVSMQTGAFGRNDSRDHFLLDAAAATIGQIVWLRASTAADCIGPGEERAGCERHCDRSDDDNEHNQSDDCGRGHGQAIRRE